MFCFENNKNRPSKLLSFHPDVCVCEREREKRERREREREREKRERVCLPLFLINERTVYSHLTCINNLVLLETLLCESELQQQ